MKTSTTYRLSAKEAADAVCAYLRNKLADRGHEPIFSAHTGSFGAERKGGEFVFEYEVEEVR